jgi:hypothetical protein
MSDQFASDNGLKQGNDLTPLLSNFLEYIRKKIGETAR